MNKIEIEGTITDKVVPNVVGVDIGCGMLTTNLGKIDIVAFLAFLDKRNKKK